MGRRGRPGGWTPGAGWGVRWLGLYWLVFALLCGAASRWADAGCRAEGLPGPCATPAFYLGVVLAALPSAAVVALAAALALALRRLRRASWAPSVALDGAAATGDVD